MSAPYELSIARDFSRFPAGRYLADGPFPGERFRPQLAAALRTHQAVTVLLDGTMGYGSSFLEESFGGLVRLEGFSAEDLRARLRVVSSDDSLIAEIWKYVSDATPE